MSHLLSVENKWKLAVDFRVSSGLFSHKHDDFLHSYVTVDEIWIKSYALEIRKQLKPWVFEDEPVPKKTETVKLANKVMAMVFLNAWEIIQINYPPPKKKIIRI